MERKRIGEKRQPSGAAVIRSELTNALYHALFEEWAETGYAAISLERIASRAGAGKAAIYRRWSSKAEFASEALQTIGTSVSDFSDHGSLKADVAAYLQATRRALRHRLIRRILPDLAAERVRSGDLSSMLDRLAASRRRHGEELLNRAIERGELRADLDRDLALDVIPSPLYWRMIVLGKRVGDAELNRQIDAVVGALQAC